MVPILILQSADALISIGSRLDTSLTRAFNEAHFGMSAQKIVVDIDQHELGPHETHTGRGNAGM